MQNILTAVICILIVVGIFAVFFLLYFADMKKNYSFDAIDKYLIQSEPLKLCVPYAIWQEHKREVIVNSTRDIITINSRQYKVTSALAEEKHEIRRGDKYPAFLYRDVMLTLKYVDVSEEHSTTVNVYGNVNKIQIDNKTIIENLQEIIAQEGYDEEIRNQLRLLYEEIKGSGLTKENGSKMLKLLDKIKTLEPIMSTILSTISILKEFL